MPLTVNAMMAASKMAAMGYFIETRRNTYEQVDSGQVDNIDVLKQIVSDLKRALFAAKISLALNSVSLIKNILWKCPEHMMFFGEELNLGKWFPSWGTLKIGIITATVLFSIAVIIVDEIYIKMLQKSIDKNELTVPKFTHGIYSFTITTYVFGFVFSALELIRDLSSPAKKLAASYCR